jgi:hypothetical protein
MSMVDAAKMSQVIDGIISARTDQLDSCHCLLMAVNPALRK